MPSSPTGAEKSRCSTSRKDERSWCDGWRFVWRDAGSTRDAVERRAVSDPCSSALGVNSCTRPDSTHHLSPRSLNFRLPSSAGSPCGRSNRNLCHRFHNSAVGDLSILARTDHPSEFAPQQCKLFDLVLDGSKLDFRKLRDLGARDLRLFLQSDENSDGRKIKSELARVPNERQPLCVVVAIKSPPVLRALSTGCETGAFVVTDRLDVDACHLRKRSNCNHLQPIDPVAATGCISS